MTWTIWQVTPQSPSRLARTGTVAAFQGGWLVFDSGTEKRRLAPVPEGWDECDDNGLVAYLRAAQAARRSAPAEE